MGMSIAGKLAFGLNFENEQLEGYVKPLDAEDDWYLYDEVEKKYPDLEITPYNSYESGDHIVALKKRFFEVDWYGVEEIDPGSMQVSADEIDALKKFCQDYKIEWQEPKWYLCVLYSH